MIKNLTKKYEVNLEVLMKAETMKFDCEIYLMDSNTKYEELEKYGIDKSSYARALNVPTVYILPRLDGDEIDLRVYRRIINLDILFSEFNISHAIKSLKKMYDLNLNTSEEVVSLQTIIGVYIINQFGPKIISEDDINRLSNIREFLNNNDINTFNKCVKIK